MGVHLSKHLLDPGLPSGLSTNPPRLREAGMLGHRDRRGLPGAGVGSTIFQLPWDMRTGFLPQDDISISQAHVASKLCTCTCAPRSTGPAWALQLFTHTHTDTHTAHSKQKVILGRVDPLIFVLKPKEFELTTSPFHPNISFRFSPHNRKSARKFQRLCAQDKKVNRDVPMKVKWRLWDRGEGLAGGEGVWL